MRNEISVRQWIVNFRLGMYEAKDYTTQCNAGWYDWFCKEGSLAGRLKKMGNVIQQIRDGGKVNLDTMYVWFKNNCPVCYPLYDDFRFANIDNGEVQLTICTGHPFGSEFMYEVWCRKNNFNGAYISFKTTKELVAWLNTPWKEEE